MSSPSSPPVLTVEDAPASPPNPPGRIPRIFEQLLARFQSKAPRGLSDYSVDARILYTSLLAALIGSVAAVAAWALLKLISLATNIFYFGHLSFVALEPFDRGGAIHHMPWYLAFMPVLGGLIVGLIARYGSPRVRGHGMPEAVETIVFNQGKVQPRLAILKPIATAVAIGSAGRSAPKARSSSPAARSARCSASCCR